MIMILLTIQIIIYLHGIKLKKNNKQILLGLAKAKKCHLIIIRVIRCWTVWVWPQIYNLPLHLSFTHIIWLSMEQLSFAHIRWCDHWAVKSLAQGDTPVLHMSHIYVLHNVINCECSIPCLWEVNQVISRC